MQQLLTFSGLRLAALTGIGVALAVGGGWIALTAATGKTYHLAPLLGTIAPALTIRAVTSIRVGGLSGLALGAIGALLMLGAWGIIVALHIEPHATLAEGIPGDVFGEVVIGAAIGVVTSILLHKRARHSSIG
ncbi:MAG: hypothetical protein ACR2OD_11860 [Gaiellaceae bacterium]